MGKKIAKLIPILGSAIHAYDLLKDINQFADGGEITLDSDGKLKQAQAPEFYDCVLNYVHAVYGPALTYELRELNGTNCKMGMSFLLPGTTDRYVGHVDTVPRRSNQPLSDLPPQVLAEAMSRAFEDLAANPFSQNVEKYNNLLRERENQIQDPYPDDDPSIPWEDPQIFPPGQSVTGPKSEIPDSAETVVTSNSTTTNQYFQTINNNQITYTTRTTTILNNSQSSTTEQPSAIPTTPTTPADPADPDPDKPPEDPPPDLCEKNPDILACKKLEEPEQTEIPKETRTIKLVDGPTFSGGSCIPDVMATVNGQSIKILETSTPCGWISDFFKPLILLLASISAVFIVMPRDS